MIIARNKMKTGPVLVERQNDENNTNSIEIGNVTFGQKHYGLNLNEINTYPKEMLPFNQLDPLQPLNLNQN